MKKYLFYLAIFLMFLTSFASQAMAANVFVVLPSVVDVGDEFEVFVNADSDGELINSASAILNYDSDFVSFSGYKTEGTMVSFLVDLPHVEDESVHMSGIIPGGVSGLYDPNRSDLAPIPLFRLLFTAKKSGIAGFTFSKTEILKHDGRGTQLPHSQKGGSQRIVAGSTSGEGEINQTIDIEKPEPFEIVFLPALPFADTPSLIMFNTTDTGSGIMKYEMKSSGSRWQEVESPHEVDRSLFSYNITIRATDFYGNFQDSTIRIPGFISFKLFTIIILLGLFCALIFKMIKYKA